MSTTDDASDENRRETLRDLAQEDGPSAEAYRQLFIDKYGADPLEESDD